MLTYPRTPTPVTKEESARLLEERYSQAFGRPPDRDTATGLLTIIWHENAKGQSIIQHNWGNLSVSARNLDTVPHWRAPWMDQDYIDSLPEGRKRQQMLRLQELAKKGKEPVAFRAFFSHAAGLDAWLKLLAGKSMNHIIKAAATGSPTALWRAVAYANPALKGATWSYCPSCRNDAVKAQYKKLHKEVNDSALFAGLKKNDREPDTDSALARLSWAGLRTASLPRLALGDHGDAVALWQWLCNAILVEMQCPPMAVDGYFGTRTYEATQFVQDRTAVSDGEGGLVCVPVTGTVGHETWGVVMTRATSRHLTPEWIATARSNDETLDVG